MKGLELKEIRKKLGLTQKEFAEMLKVNARTIQKWENGEVEIHENNAFMIKERTKGAIDNNININQSNQSGDNIIGEAKKQELALKDKEIELLKKEVELLNRELELLKGE